MKNNIILEDRPELTNEQIMLGMDFNKIKTNAALAKTALLKSLIIKGLLGIVIISSPILIYQNNKSSAPDKNQIVLVDTAKIISPTEKDSAVIQPEITIDKTPTTNIEHKTTFNKLTPVTSISIDTSTNNATTNNSGIKTDVNTVKKGQSQDDTLTGNSKKTEQNIKLKNNYKLNRFTKCKLWKSKNFCDLPKKANLSSSYDVDDAEYDFVSCKEATKNMATIKAVWITIDAKGRTKLQLESQLKNITLIRSGSGKSIHPLMIAAVNGGNSFFGKNFKAKKFTANYDGPLDIFLFFPEAEVDDTIIINNFIETVILE